MAKHEQTIFSVGQTETLQPMRSVLVQFLGGTPAPVRLALSTEVQRPLEVGPGKHPAGTILAAPLTIDAALDLFAQIRDLALTLGWTLPR